MSMVSKADFQAFEKVKMYCILYCKFEAKGVELVLSKVFDLISGSKKYYPKIQVRTSTDS